jgi:hypothetical protein
MKLTISLFLASLAISSSGYLGWRIWQPNLTGHWHIMQGQLEENHSAHDWMETLDITSDNSVYLNYDSENPFPVVGNISRLFRNMYFGPGCLSLDVNYHPDGNTLHLEIPNYSNLSDPCHLNAVRNVKCHHSWKPEF